jgi:protein ImuA
MLDRGIMPAVTQREVLEELRERIRRIERRPPRRAAFEATGLERVDALLPGGGFPRGALSEISGGPGSGKTALCLAAMARAMRGEGLAAFVDGRGELYPPAAEALGVDLSRLLIVRPPPGEPRGPALTALWSAEALLSSGAFELVAMDVAALPSGARRGPPALARARGGASPEAMVRRLLAAAEKGGAVGLWLAAPGELRVPAAVRLEVECGADGPRVWRAEVRGAPREAGHGA